MHNRRHHNTEAAHLSQPTLTQSIITNSCDSRVARPADLLKRLQTGHHCKTCNMSQSRPAIIHKNNFIPCSGQLRGFSDSLAVPTGPKNQ
ncbi:hypothetical protein SAMN05216600_10521 [Pseudomonas cuatrocienegasensis]|uniref:Uncharacterized protein n=1 Tax=Pseudomonas cuatrocienegasensis TaxID=543360 RepID=A0ABY1B9Q3_9PSED|nr:hypothetical protein A7D25_09330 [Pseudomonas sp. 21C1]SEQ31817.1 hypothetical protein SAMN05216600_10521 [Pseudomonas cuatrocienegasensis]